MRVRSSSAPPELNLYRTLDNWSNIKLNTRGHVAGGAEVAYAAAEGPAQPLLIPDIGEGVVSPAYLEPSPKLAAPSTPDTIRLGDPETPEPLDQDPIHSPPTVPGYIASNISQRPPVFFNAAEYCPKIEHPYFKNAPVYLYPFQMMPTEYSPYSFNTGHNPCMPQCSVPSQDLPSQCGRHQKPCAKSTKTAPNPAGMISNTSSITKKLSLGAVEDLDDRLDAEVNKLEKLMAAYAEYHGVEVVSPQPGEDPKNGDLLTISYLRNAQATWTRLQDLKKKLQSVTRDTRVFAESFRVTLDAERLANADAETTAGIDPDTYEWVSQTASERIATQLGDTETEWPSRHNSPCVTDVTDSPRSDPFRAESPDPTECDTQEVDGTGPIIDHPLPSIESDLWGTVYEEGPTQPNTPEDSLTEPNTPPITTLDPIPHIIITEASPSVSMVESSEKSLPEFTFSHAHPLESIAEESISDHATVATEPSAEPSHEVEAIATETTPEKKSRRTNRNSNKRQKMADARARVPGAGY